MQRNESNESKPVNTEKQSDKNSGKSSHVPVQRSNVFIARHLSATFLNTVSENQLTSATGTILSHVPDSCSGITGSEPVIKLTNYHISCDKCHHVPAICCADPALVMHQCNSKQNSCINSH